MSPHWAAASDHLALCGCQDEGWCQQQSGLCGRFTLSPRWQLSTLIVPFFSEYLSCLLFHTNSIGFTRVLNFQTPSSNLSFLASLSAAERHGELPSDPYPCANLPLLK